MQINQLSRADTITAGDLTVIFSTNNGDTRAASMSALLAFLQNNIENEPENGSGDEITQYAAPNANGFNIAIAPATSGENIYLQITPTGAFAAGTITLPQMPAFSVNGQYILVSCTQAVTALTVAGNGATVNGAPTTLGTNGFFRLRFDNVSNSWYRVG